MSRLRTVLPAVLAVCSLLVIPVGAIVLAGVLSGFPIVEPLRPYVWPAVRLALLVAVMAAVMLLIVRLLGPERVSVLRARFQEWRWSAVAGQVVFAAAFVVGLWLGMGLLALLELAWIVLLFVGFGLLGSAGRRVGEEVCCAKCSYPQVGASIAAEEREDRCPECGAYWRRWGGVVKGRRHIHKGMIAVGIGLMVLSFGWNFGRVAFPEIRKFELALIPTRVLIDSVATSRSFTRDQMEAIGGRTLSREHELRLISGLLDKRARGEGLFGEERAWLERAFNSGLLLPEMEERFFAEELEVGIDGPQRAEVGEEVSVGIRVLHRDMNFGTVHTMYVAFGGYFVDDVEPALERRDEPIHASFFGRVRPSFQRDRGPHSTDANPELMFRAEGPGAMRVRAVMWVYAVPYNTPSDFTWEEDGTPAMPAGTMWRERIEIAHEIEVGP